MLTIASMPVDRALSSFCSWAEVMRLLATALSRRAFTEAVIACSSPEIDLPWALAICASVLPLCSCCAQLGVAHRGTSLPPVVSRERAKAERRADEPEAGPRSLELRVVDQVVHPGRQPAEDLLLLCRGEALVGNRLVQPRLGGGGDRLLEPRGRLALRLGDVGQRLAALKLLEQLRLGQAEVLRDGDRRRVAVRRTPRGRGRIRTGHGRGRRGRQGLPGRAVR